MEDQQVVSVVMTSMALRILDGQAGNAGADELHDLVLDIAILVDGIRRCSRATSWGPMPGPGLAGQIDGDDLRTGEVIGAAQKLLCQLGAALADTPW